MKIRSMHICFYAYFITNMLLYFLGFKNVSQDGLEVKGVNESGEKNDLDGSALLERQSFVDATLAAEDNMSVVFIDGPKS